MKNANLPFDRLMALSKAEGLRYPHSSSLRRTTVYASLLDRVYPELVEGGALYLSVFGQPESSEFFSS